MIVPEYSDDFPVGPRDDIAATLPQTVHWQSRRTNPDEHERPLYVHRHVAAVAYRAGVLDPLLRLVADDRAGETMILAPNAGVILKPYDGGVDVIMGTSVERDALKAHHHDWLSAHPKGL